MDIEMTEMTVLRGKTVGNLFDFLLRSVETGLISASLSAHLRAAVKKIFTATCTPAEFWRDVALESVDLEIRIAELRARNHGECSDQTIYVYEKRYLRSLRLYIDFLASVAFTPDDDSVPKTTFAPEQNPISKKDATVKSASVSKKVPTSLGDPSPTLLVHALALASRSSLFCLKAELDVTSPDSSLSAFLLRPASLPKTGYLVLPSSLSLAELEKIELELSSVLALLKSAKGGNMP